MILGDYFDLTRMENRLYVEFYAFNHQVCILNLMILMKFDLPIGVKWVKIEKKNTIILL